MLSEAVRRSAVLVSADTDFGTLLAATAAREPSVILLRREMGRRPAQQLEVLLANLPQLEKPLEEGSIAVISDERIRVRQLPLVR